MTQGIGGLKLPESEGVRPPEKATTQKLPIAAPIPVIMTDKPKMPKTPIAELPHAKPVDAHMDQVAVKAVTISQKTILINSLLEELEEAPNGDIRNCTSYPKFLALFQNDTGHVVDIAQAIANNNQDLEEAAKQLQDLIELAEKAYKEIAAEKNPREALQQFEEALRQEFPDEGAPEMVLLELVRGRFDRLYPAA